MKNLLWIIILFAAAIGIATVAGTYSGDVYIHIGSYLTRMNLHAFVIAVLISVILLYALFRLLSHILGVPAWFHRLGIGRNRRKANNNLNAAGLAYFEGKYQLAEREAAKVLANKQATDTRSLALMIAAHAADAMDDATLREKYLVELAQLPHKQQLSRYMLQAESALNHRDYQTAQSNIEAAAHINGSLTRLVKIQLRYAFDQGNVAEVLDKTAKLQKASALNSNEVAQYQEWAYRQLISKAQDERELKSALKQMPEEWKAGKLCSEIAEKWMALGHYASVADWVQKYYPINNQASLLSLLAQSSVYLSEREQRKYAQIADSWLQKQPDNADLQLYLGQIAFGQKEWDKARIYLDNSLKITENAQARLLLSKVLDEENKKAQEKAAIEVVETVEVADEKIAETNTEKAEEKKAD